MREGELVVVGTPIGNLADLSERARAELASVDAVACEDTRRTGRLYQLAGLATRPPFLTLHEHNEASQCAAIVDRIRRGERIAVVSDAGMPGISDPGERVVAAVVAAGLTVTVVPGPSAALAALVVSGLPSGRFVFEGFLPRRGRARAARLDALATEERSTVLYESPHRVADTLSELADRLGAQRPVAIARELTKLHEEVWRGTLADAAAWAAATPPRGEVALVVGGAAPAGPVDDATLATAVAEALAAGRSRRDAATAVAERFGVSRRRVYDLTL